MTTLDRILRDPKDSRRKVIRFWLDNMGHPREQRVLLVHDAQSAADIARVRAVLAREFPSATFVTTTDPERARRNLQRLKPVLDGPMSNIEPVLVRESLLTGQYGRITDGAGATGDWVELSEAAERISLADTASDTLLVIGDANAKLARELREAGNLGYLQGKAVVIWACGRPDWQMQARELIEDYGAVLVWRAARPIEAMLIPVLTAALNGVMADSPRTVPSELMQKVIEEAVRRVEASDRQDKDKEDLIRKIEALLDGELLSRRDGRGGENDKWHRAGATLRAVA